MLKTGLQKEFMYLSRTGKLVGVIIAMLVFALCDGLMLKATTMMMDTMATTVEQQAQNINDGSETAAEFNEIASSMNTLTNVYKDMDAPYVTASSIMDISGLGILITLLVIKSACGGEQKKRSVVIPRCAGLTPKMYIMPKFILYPAIIFVLAFLAVFISGGMAVLLFEGSVPFTNLLVSGLCLGVYLAFVMILMLTLGICTAKPGVSVILVLVMVNILPTLLASYRVDRFNPFALPNIISNSVMAGGDLSASLDVLNLSVSLGVTVVLSAILYFVTLFAISAKEVRNEGNEPVL